MRNLVAVAPLVVILAGCGSKSGAPEATSGPIESTVKTTRDAVRVKAVRHEVPLAELPYAATLRLPLIGTVVVDADLTIPIVDGKRDYRHAKGTASARCKGRCTIGNDVTKLKLSDDPAAFVTEVDFGHIDLDKLEASAEVVDGRAKISNLVQSPDLTLHVDLSIELAAEPGQSEVVGCVRYKPSDALKLRDPKMYALIALIGGLVGPDGDYYVALSGRADQLAAKPHVCP
jgi:hypothetical protein